jgi:lipopolysaccharide/colanic/teichoic acid biosynthesis glycosyltransferase
LPLCEAPSVAAQDARTLAERYARLAVGGAPRRYDPVLRALDVVIAATVLLLVSPVLAVLIAGILVTSGPPVFYRGERVGRYGRVFTMRKLRTLKRSAEERLGSVYGAELTTRTQEETTQLGRFLRASQLDELPQLWNVLRGDMSIVGPRPVRPVFFEQLTEEIPAYWQRLVVRPGLTGFAQTRMGREEAWAEKLVHDLEWIADRSPRLYLRIVAATAVRVLSQSLAGLLGRRT